MSIKRKLAEWKIKARNKKRIQAERDIEKLRISRNKSLRDAEVALRKAKAEEDARDAKIVKARAYGLTNKGRQQAQRKAAGKAAINDIVKGAKKLAKNIATEPSKPKRRKVIVKKTYKRR